jgi:hypothetical protein
MPTPVRSRLLFHSKNEYDVLMKIVHGEHGSGQKRMKRGRFATAGFLLPFIFLSIFLFLAAGRSSAQDDPSQRPSPPAKTSCTFADGKKITVDYSSPRIRGRKIFGGLVPYGEVWRAGANEATTFVVNTNVTINGKPVPAGSYTLFTFPNPDKWQLIISKQTGEWGIPYPGEEYDFGRVPMQLTKLATTVRNFLIAFDKSGDRCTMRLDWENTRASVEIAEKK